jgi:hypothetical protein
MGNVPRDQVASDSIHDRESRRRAWLLKSKLESTKALRSPYNLTYGNHRIAIFSAQLKVRPIYLEYHVPTTCWVAFNLNMQEEIK